MSHENWSNGNRSSRGRSRDRYRLFKDFDPDTDSDSDPDGFWFRLFSEQLFMRCGAPKSHEKMIAQSRDRQGADPLADARGSVRISIFETDGLILKSPTSGKAGGLKTVNRSKRLL
jgi:hypothetical protein